MLPQMIYAALSEADSLCGVQFSEMPSPRPLRGGHRAFGLTAR